MVVVAPRGRFFFSGTLNKYLFVPRVLLIVNMDALCMFCFDSSDAVKLVSIVFRRQSSSPYHGSQLISI